MDQTYQNIRVKRKTAKRLGKLGTKNDTYDDIITKLIYLEERKRLSER